MNIADIGKFVPAITVGKGGMGEGVGKTGAGDGSGRQPAVLREGPFDPVLQDQFDRVDIRKIGEPPPLKRCAHLDGPPEETFDFTEQDAEEIAEARKAVGPREGEFQRLARRGQEIQTEVGSFVPLAMSDEDEKELAKKQAGFDKLNTVVGQQRSLRNRWLDDGYKFVCAQTEELLKRQDTSTSSGRMRAKVALVCKFVADFVNGGDWSGEDMQVKAFEIVAAKIDELKQTGTKAALQEAEELRRANLDFRFALDGVRRSRMQLVQPLVDRLRKVLTELSDKDGAPSARVKELHDEAEKLKTALSALTKADKAACDRAFAFDASCKDAFERLDKRLGGKLKAGGLDYEPGKGGFGPGAGNAGTLDRLRFGLKQFALMTQSETDTEGRLKVLLKESGFALKNGVLDSQSAAKLKQETLKRKEILQSVDRLERSDITGEFEVLDDLHLEQYDSLRQRVLENVKPNPRTIDGRLRMVADATAKEILRFAEAGWKPSLDRLDAEIGGLDAAIEERVAGGGDPEGLADLREKRARLTECRAQLRKAADEIVRSRMAMLDPVVRALVEADIRYETAFDGAAAVKQIRENLGRLKNAIGAFRLDFDNASGVRRGKWESFKRWLGSAFSAGHGKVLNKVVNVFKAKERIGFRQETFNDALLKTAAYNRLVRDLGRETPYVKDALTPIGGTGDVLANGEAARSFSDSLHEINNSIRNTPEDQWLSTDFYVRMARKRLEGLVPNGGSREFAYFLKAGAGFSLSENVKAEVLGKDGACYKVRCEGDGTVVVRVEGKVGVEGIARASFGDNVKLKGKVALEGGGGVEFRYGDMESAVQAIGGSFLGKVGLSRTLDTAFRTAKTIFWPVVRPATWIWGKIVGNERYSDAEFVQKMKERGVLDEMAKEAVVGKNILMTGYRKFGAVDFGASVDAKFKLGGANLGAGDETTRREIADLSAGAGLNVGGDIASQTEYRPYLVYLQKDVAGTALKSFEASIRRGGSCLLGDGAAAALAEALKDDAVPSSDDFGRLFEDLSGNYLETARIETDALKELDLSGSAKREQLKQLADRIRTTTEGVVALYEKWKASDACRDADQAKRDAVERSFTFLRDVLVKPPIEFGDDFRHELMVERSFADNTFRANFSAYFNANVLTGLTNKMMVETDWLDDLAGTDATKFFRRGAMAGAVGIGGYTPLDFKIGFDAEIVKPTSDHLESWRNVGQTKLNFRLGTGHLESYALLSIIGTAVARQTGQPPPTNPSGLLAVLKSAGIFGAGLSAVMQMGKDLYNRIGKPLVGMKAVSGTQTVLAGAKDFLAESTVDLDNVKGANVQIVMVDNRVQTISFGTQDSVSLSVTVGEGFRFGVEYKDRNVVNQSTVYLDAPLTTLLDRCDRMTNGAQTSLWQEFGVRNRRVFAKLYDTIRDGLVGRLTPESAPSQVKDYNYLADEIRKIRDSYEAVRDDPSVPWAVRRSLMENARELEEALLAIRDAAGTDGADPQDEVVRSTKTEAVRTVLERIVGHYHILDVAQKRVTGGQAETSEYRVGDMRSADEALEELGLIRDEVEKFKSDDSVVRLSYTDPTEERGREIAAVTEDTTDSVRGFLSVFKFGFTRSRALKFKNNCDRNAVKTLVFRACGVSRYIDLPQDVKDVFKVDDFNADGRPLTKRRLLAIVDAVRRAGENGSIRKTRKPLEKGVLVQTPGSNCCFANVIVNGLKATERGRLQLESVIGEDGCSFFGEDGQKTELRFWPANADWGDDKTFSPFETLVMEHMQSVDGIYGNAYRASVQNGTSRPLGHVEKAAAMFGLRDDEVLEGRVDRMLFAPEIDEPALGSELSRALDRGEVVVCNRTGGHFETITEVDVRTGLCKTVSDVPDVNGGCVRWRRIKTVAQEMKGVGTTFQFFRVKQGEEERRATLARLAPEIIRLRKRFGDGNAQIDRFAKFLASDEGRSVLQSLADNDKRFTLETAYADWLQTTVVLGDTFSNGFLQV